MDNRSKVLRQLFGLGTTILVIVVLLAIFRWNKGIPFTAQTVTAEKSAYPVSEKVDTLQPYPPPPPKVISITFTPTQLPPKVITGVLSPGRLTDLPWPYIPANPTPTPTATPLPFPTPDFLLAPERELPTDLWQVLYPFFPKFDRDPQIWAAKIDRQGRYWGSSELALDLQIPRPKQRGFPFGPYLYDLHLSPNSAWLVADVYYLGSQLVDLSTGVKVDFITGANPNWNFYNWTAGGSGIVYWSAGEYKIVDLRSLKTDSLVWENDEANPTIYAIAYSPDGLMIADGRVYPATVGIREEDLVEIGLRNSKNGERVPLVQEVGGRGGGNYVVFNSLKWSPNGDKLLWIIHMAGEENHGNQLWISEPVTGTAKMLGTLGKPAEYTHQAMWSPDGSIIAVLKVDEVGGSKDIANNIYLVNPETGGTKQLTHFAGRRLSHLAWTPDGKWLAYSMLIGDYSEIWIVRVDGAEQYPIAGPTIPNAPFVILGK